MKSVLWWELHEGVLDHEIELLSNAGWLPKVDEAAKAGGRIVINVFLSIHEEKRDAQISFPDLYPYFRPHVFVDGLEALRHYNPLSGNLCLLKRGTDQWQPGDSACEMIQAMLPEWEKASVRQYDDERLDGEDHQAEPCTVYLPASTQLIAIDSDFNIPDSCECGTVSISLSGGIKTIKSTSPFLGWMLSVSDETGTQIPSATASDQIIGWANSMGHEKVQAKWCKLSELPVPFTLESILDCTRKSAPRFWKIIEKQLRNRKGGVFGFCLKEENPQGGMRDGWFFLHINFTKSKGKQTPAAPVTKVINAEYAGEKDFFERIPELHPLRKKTVAVVGLGCVGAPSVLEFAKAGIGELRLLDADYISPGTISRWPLGLSIAGQGKVQALIDHIQRNYPFTSIGTAHHMGTGDDFRLHIGGPSDAVNQRKIIDAFLDGVDLVYDASAEIGISQMVTHFAKERGIPSVVVASRPGGWGGDVVRVMPNAESGCFLCYLMGQETGRIPNPAYDEQGDDLQPVGCGDITFKASSFDVQTVSFSGVRIAVSTLCNQEEGYPEMNSDYGVMTVREHGKAIFPSWQSGPLPKHSNCPLCGHK